MPEPDNWHWRNPEGSVYLVLDKRSRLVKIGFTSGCVYERIATGVGFNPNPIRLLGFFPARKAAEKTLHRRYRAQRRVREWFQQVPELLDYFAQRTEAVDEVLVKQILKGRPRGQGRRLQPRDGAA